jgi:vitamin B12 transporter
LFPFAAENREPFAALAMKTNRLALLLLCSPLAASAQQDSLPRVVITATKVATTAGSGVSAATVFDRAFIERSGVRDVAELLRLVPGAVMARSGGPGAQSSLFLRGGENDYVRVLIDGVPVNDPGGALDFAWLSIDDVERIEVVRGPASVLYGTDAVTGVVQLFTRRAAHTAAEGEVAMGRYGHRLVRGNASTGTAAFNLTLGGATEQSDGLLPFNSQYSRDVASASLRAMTPATRLDFSVRGVNDEFHFPTDGAGGVSDSNAFRDNRRVIAAATVAHTLSSRVTGELAVTAMNSRGEDDNRPDSPGDTAGFYYYDALTSVRRRGVEGRVNVLVSSSSILTLGAEAVREAQRGNDSSNFSVERSRFVADRRNEAVFAQWLSEQGRVALTAGARYDENSTFGSFRTARAGVAIRAWAGGTLRTTIGTAFKAPTFFESFNTAFSTGNADLEPERSRSWEAGLRHTTGQGRIALGATWFDQHFRDMIQYAFVSPELPNYFNVAAASARGLELEATTRPAARLTVGANLTVLRTRVDDAGLQTGESATFVEGNRLLRRPSTQASATMGIDLPARATADIAVTYTGDRDDRDFSTFPATPVVLPSWTRVDLGFTKAIELGARFELRARIENLLGASYEEIANYPAAGRSLTIGVRAATLRR